MNEGHYFPLLLLSGVVWRCIAVRRRQLYRSAPPSAVRLWAVVILCLRQRSLMYHSVQLSVSQTEITLRCLQSKYINFGFQCLREGSLLYRSAPSSWAAAVPQCAVVSVYGRDLLFDLYWPQYFKKAFFNGPIIYQQMGKQPTRSTKIHWIWYGSLGLLGTYD